MFYFTITLYIYQEIELNDDTDNFVIHQKNGKKETYPHRVRKPAFTGLMLWEIQLVHPFNDYKISRHHNVKSGIIIIIGNEAYIFTPISSNNDIQSYLKILLQAQQNPSLPTKDQA